MASFNEHIQQAKNNFNFLCQVNQSIANSYDWQVTVCFYTALHLVNAHLSTFDLQYRKHSDVNHALNPDVALSVSKLPEDEYDAYIALQRLSRRSRYLVNEKNDIAGPYAYFTYDKHLAKAVRHLNRLIVFFQAKYKFTVSAIDFSCAELSANENLLYFNIK